MEITSQEMRLIERLRKQDRQWLWARWFLLAAGILSLALCAACGYVVHRLVSESAQGHLDSDTVFLIVLFWTKCCFYFVFGVWCIIQVWLKWHGDVTRILLLKLLDAHQRAA